MKRLRSGAALVLLQKNTLHRVYCCSSLSFTFTAFTSMIKLFCLSLLISVTIASAIAQPGSTAKKTTADQFCDSLLLIIKNSSQAYLHQRYNETQGSVSLSYTTTLPTLGFTKRFVQITSLKPHKQKAAATLPCYIATSSFKTISEARQFYYSIKSKMIACIKPVSNDSAMINGFDRYSSWQVSKPVKDSFVSIELFILPDENSALVATRIFHNKASSEKGVMKNPPVKTTANSMNEFNSMPNFLQNLIELSAADYYAIRGTLLTNQQFYPTYSSLIKYKDFTAPKIEYVTKNIWNQYSATLYLPNKEIAEARFKELTAEIDNCQTAIPSQQFSSSDSKSTDKWWNYLHQRNDVQGTRYKNQLRLTLIKAEQGDGYIISFEFRKFQTGS